MPPTGTVDYLIDAKGPRVPRRGETTLEHLGFAEVPSAYHPRPLAQPVPTRAVRLSAEAAGKPPG